MAKKQKWLIVGNWKMNPEDLRDAKRIFQGIKKHANKYQNVQTVICPPYLYLESLKKLVTGHRCLLGAQDFYYEPTGAFTGYIGSEQLKNTGIKYAIVGHSERRERGETNEEVNKKMKACLAYNIVPIMCVGEKKRDADLEYLKEIKEQLTSGLKDLPKSKASKIVVAYEPIWAIGKKAKRPPKPEEVREIVIFIKRVIGDIYKTNSVPPTKIIYGGSVKDTNAEELLTNTMVDGFLPGGASLKPEIFGSILKIAANKK